MRFVMEAGSDEGNRFVEFFLINALIVLIFVINVLWGNKGQGFFGYKNMEHLTCYYMEILNSQYTDVVDQAILAVWDRISMRKEVTSTGSDQQASIQKEVTSAGLELQTFIQELIQRRMKMESIKPEVGSIRNEYADWRTKYGAIRELPPPPAQESPSTPNVRGMDSNLVQILHYLKEGVNIIGIWGMGGVGKTTLLKEINNHFARNQHPSLDHVIFAVASKDGNLEELQKKILKNLQLPLQTVDDVNSRAARLLRFLKRKKVLLLLDDLWEHVNLVVLGVPLGQGVCNCKVIFTAQSIAVCHSMIAERVLKVECLNTKEAWSLFQKNVGEDIIKADPIICHLAEEVARKCYGLPLALITIGRAMSNKKTWGEWQDALNLLHHRRQDEISGMMDDMFLILEFGFKNLQNDVMRECFLACSMWPEDYDISRYDLIKCWMGLGLIDDYNEISEAYDRGHSIIESLIGACLLEHGEVDYGMADSSVKMHDVLRDLAFWIASDHGKVKDKWLVQAGVGVRECNAEKWVGPHRMSLMFNHIESLPEQLPNCPNLSVLMLRETNLENIPEGLFNCLSSLTYLDLSCSSIEELPSAIGGMVNLKFLNLQFTSIKYLPYELGNLVNLKYLLLGDTYYMESIPWKSISSLPMLKLLDLFDCRGAKQMESQGGFEALQQLDGRLMGLGINIDKLPSLTQLSKFFTISIMELQINNLKGTKSLELLLPNLFGSKSTSDSLKVLNFIDCKSLKMLIVNSLDLGGIPRSASLPRLERLELEELPELEKIVWSGVAPKEFLPSLCNLRLCHCRRLKDVSWVLQLPNLKCLQLVGCDELETVIRDAKDGGGVEEIVDRVDEHILGFPRLRWLELVRLSNLSSICSTIILFSSLEEISVKDCPKLKRLPFQAPNIPNKLQVIGGEAEWWEDLEWEDDCTKASLQSIFGERQ